jgi:hypothetical protein
MWINTNSLAVYKLHHEIRAAFPNTSMPELLSEEIFAQFDIVPVIQTSPPSGYVVVELPPILINGNWTQQWTTREPTEDETLANATEVRAERNTKLAESDWTQVLDAPIDQPSWALYRQALRDLTAQPGFPWTVEWPEAPQ